MIMIKQLSMGIFVAALVSSGALAQSYNVGETVSAANSPTYVYPETTSSGSANPWIGNDAYGNHGHVLAAAQPGGPNTGWLYQVAFDDNLTGWVYESDVSAVDARAPKVTFSATDIVSPATSATLSWTASAATCASAAGYPSFSTSTNPATVSPSQGTGITCTLSGHSTTRYAAVNMNITPTYPTWSRSLRSPSTRPAPPTRARLARAMAGLKPAR